MLVCNNFDTTEFHTELSIVKYKLLWAQYISTGAETLTHFNASFRRTY